MKHTIKYIATAATMIIGVSHIAEANDAKGTVILANGTIYEAMRINGCFVSGESITYKPIGSSEITVPTTAIKSIAIINAGEWYSGRYTPSEAIIEFQNGNKLPVERLTSGNGSGSKGCDLKVKDPTSGIVVDIEAEFNENDHDDRVVEIRLDSVGEFNWSESSQTAFPRSFLFDPFTGEVLKPVTFD